MKKIIIIALLCIVVFGLWAARPRSYTQLLVNSSYPGLPASAGDYQLPNLTNTSSSTSPDYILSAYVTTRPTEIISTLVHPSSTIRVFRFGNGINMPYVSAAVLGFGTFPTEWAGGETIHFDITHIPTGHTGSWELVIPDNNTTSIGYRQTINPIPYVIAPPWITTYTLTVTSTPDGKPIYKDNVDTGQVTPYTFDPGEAGTYKVVDPLYTWEPAEIVVPALTENTTINFVGTLIPPDTYTYNLHINGPGGGYAVTGPTAAFNGTIPYTATSNVVTDLVGNYTVAAPPAGYQWVVNPIAVTAEMFNLVTKKNGGMDKVVLGSRTNGAKTNYVYEATITFALEELPPQNYTVTITSVPIGAAIYVGGVDSGQITPHTFTLAAGTGATYTVVMDHFTWNPTEFVVTNISENMSCNFIGTPYFDIPEGTPILPPGASVTVTLTITGGNANYGSGVLPPWVNPSFVAVEQYFLDLIGAGPWTITFNTTAPWGAYFLSGIWNAVQNVGGTITFTITGAKDVSDLPIVLGDTDPTLPVELSYFAATLTAENFVNIAWTTQTETNMNGFNIYRNEGSDILAGAIQIAYIPATNTSTTHNYEHLDNKDLENGHTYYYWLECVEISGHSTFNGPRSAYVDGPTPPVLPEYTIMHNAYPNPFKAGTETKINVDLKTGDTGTVTIYNILGQVVKTFSVNEGNNELKWYGRDSKGNLCGNGIYFYKLSTNSRNQTKKMVIVK